MSWRGSAARAARVVASAAVFGVIVAFFLIAQKTPADTPAPAAKPAPASPTAKTPAKSGSKSDVAKAEPVEPADNSYCLVCHLNYENEKLVKAHQPSGIGCEKCHGMSVKHSADEDGLTPPDTLYESSEVNKYCFTCHGNEKERLLKQKEHKEFFGKTPAELLCNDCHGEHHRLKNRTRVWDKTTRKLVRDDGVRMMYKDSPATTGKAGTSKQAPQVLAPDKPAPAKPTGKKS